MTPRIFISYAPEDAEWKDRLLEHLGGYEGVGLLDVWSADRLDAGDDWRSGIEDALRSADAAALLISASWFNSELIWEHEIPLIRQRRAEGIPVLPIIVKPCGWTAVDWLQAMQHLPGGDETLSSGTPHEIESKLARVARTITECCAAAAAAQSGEEPTAATPLDFAGDGSGKPQYVGYLAHERVRATFAQVDRAFLLKAGRQAPRLAGIGFGPTDATSAGRDEQTTLAQLDVTLRYIEETSSVVDLEEVVQGRAALGADWYFLSTQLRVEEWDDADPGLTLVGGLGDYTVKLSCAKSGFSGLHVEDGRPIPTSTNRFLFRGEAALPMRGLVRLAYHDAQQKVFFGSPLFLILLPVGLLDEVSDAARV